MGSIRHVGVIDIGKTNVKVAVVDLENQTEITALKRANTIVAAPPYPHYDVEGHWNFILEALASLYGRYPFDAIATTTHGASIVLLDATGNLATPVLDYEHDGPDALAEQYDEVRPSFAETGSPRLSVGLNVGAQLHWLLETDPALAERVAVITTYPQYWTYRLTGKLANEVTSLGCHTDLWNPEQRRYSSLVERLGLTSKMAPVRKAVDIAGTLLPDVAESAGLPPDLVVSCGIHDSNASLLPHLLQRQAPFSVVSTGTWVIALAIGGEDVVLDPERDTLTNVNAFGDPVPSARFMGGREFDTVMEGRPGVASETEVLSVLQKQIMLFPAIETRSGPYQGRLARWSIEEASLTDGERFAAVSCYLAMMTTECLRMIGASGLVIVEGPFAQNALYLDMLRAATARDVEVSQGASTGTSIGAALLACHDKSVAGKKCSPLEGKRVSDPLLKAYADAWIRQTVN